MTFLIAAAGTGGHVYPGLSVAEALVRLDVPKQDIMFVGVHVSNQRSTQTRVSPSFSSSFGDSDVRSAPRTSRFPLLWPGPRNALRLP